MEREQRIKAIRNRMAVQIEVIVEAICEGRLPIAEERLLQALAVELAAEEVGRNKERTYH